MNRRGPAPHDFPVAETSLRVMKIIFGSLAHAHAAGAVAPARGVCEALPGWSFVDLVPRLPLHHKATDCAAAPEEKTA